MIARSYGEGGSKVMGSDGFRTGPSPSAELIRAVGFGILIAAPIVLVILFGRPG